MPELAREMMKVTFDVARQSARIVQSLLPGREHRVCWQEFQNKLEAFTAFACPSCESSLPDAIAAAAALDPYASVWTTEGLGYCEAESCRLRGARPCGLISAALPSHSLIPLHAGMGLSLACRSLESAAPLADRLASFQDLCAANALDGYTGVCCEALGLIARNLHPELLLPIDRLLERDPDRLGYFWHGVGRGIYFVPTNFPTLASAPWRSVNMALAEPPHEFGAANAIAGLVWAFNLVNVRHPEILDTFLDYHGAELDANDAFWNGRACSALVWRMSTDGNSHGCCMRPEELFRYRHEWHGFAAH